MRSVKTPVVIAMDLGSFLVCAGCSDDKTSTDSATDTAVDATADAVNDTELDTSPAPVSAGRYEGDGPVCFFVGSDSTKVVADSNCDGKAGDGMAHSFIIEFTDGDDDNGGTCNLDIKYTADIDIIDHAFAVTDGVKPDTNQTVTFGGAFSLDGLGGSGSGSGSASTAGCQVNYSVTFAE